MERGGRGGSVLLRKGAACVVACHKVEQTMEGRRRRG